MTQKKEMGNMRSVRIQNVNFNSKRSAANLKEVSRILKQWHNGKDKK
jgi:hypothetical protein